MTRWRNALIAPLVVTAALSVRQATACSCVGLATTAYLRDSDIVYTGTVTAIRNGRPEIEFRVERVIKGPVRPRRFLLSAPINNGGSCDGFNFEVGKKYLVFANARNSAAGLPGTYGVNLCGGTISLESASGRRRLRETMLLMLK